RPNETSGSAGRHHDHVFTPARRTPQGSEGLTWITAAFMIAVVVFEFTFGVLGDLFGRRRLIAAGAAMVVVGSIVSSLAPNVQTLWVGAALNGLGAGAMFPGSLTMIADVARTARERARAIALWSGFLSAGAAVSPLIGGVFAKIGSWRGSYLVLVALALASVLLSLTMAKESKAAEGRRLDVPGQITFALGLILVLYAAVEGPDKGWGEPDIIGAFAVGACFLAAFVLIERRADSPILNLTLFKDRAFTVGSIVAVIGMIAFLGACFTTSMWLGPVQHQDPLRVAVPFLLLQGPAFVLIPVVSRLLHKVAPNWLLTTGFLLMAVGSFLCTRLDVTDTSLTPFILPTLLIGIGFALGVSSITAVALNSVPGRLAGMASATTNMLRDLGFALGPVVVGAVALSRAGDTFSSNLAGADLPPDQLGAATEIGQAAGPIAVNSLPPDAPGAAAQSIALDALGSGYSLAYMVCAVAALVAAIVTVVGMAGVRAPQALDTEDTAGKTPAGQPQAPTAV
ncbi:MFS transporter, partial [Streptomyces hirsutus]|uniref:MFS transporter n=1 Tax=Streptomyces hirsutus TaxID=35620 RepID=UPI00368253D6